MSDLPAMDRGPQGAMFGYFDLFWPLGRREVVFQTRIGYDLVMMTEETMQLPLHERLQIMAAIGEDLRGRVESVGISQEQKNLLDTRRKRVASGEAKILDWDQVKHSIARA